LSIFFSLGLSLLSVLTILRRFVGFPEAPLLEKMHSNDLASPGEGR
jgi:hypothetical protein